MVVTNANAEAGKQCRAILPSYKNAVCQSSGGTAAKSRQGAFLPEGYGFPVFTILAVFQQIGNASQGIALGVNLLDLNGTYLLPVGDAIEAGTGYRISFSILCNVNGEYLVAQLVPLWGLGFPDGIVSIPKMLQTVHPCAVSVRVRYLGHDLFPDRGAKRRIL